MHCHILYGIDDGCKTIKESIETIKKMKSIGFDTIVLTPHYIEDSSFKADNSLKLERLEILKVHHKKAKQIKSAKKLKGNINAF